MIKKCYICGCVRNCAQYLDKVFGNVIKISEIFDEYRIIIAYDSSNDRSLEILFKLKKKYFNINIKILININELSMNRTFNIANARNLILENIRNHNDKSYKYFIMMDMDDVCCNLVNNPNILNYYIEKNYCWDSLSFNRTNYYDIWALSIQPYLFSCWNFGDSSFSIESRKNSVLIIKDYISNLLNNLKNDDLLSCHSAFNGFAIYKKDKFLNCRYDGNIINSVKLLGDDLISIQEKSYNKKFYTCVEDCEHRFFHIQAIKKNQAKIRISPIKFFD